MFQHKLGSLLDKTERITQLATEIAKVIGANRHHRESGAALKCDLVSEMVLEFPDLQGIAGRQYAVHDGEDLDVAAAIESHYYPRFAGIHSRIRRGRCRGTGRSTRYAGWYFRDRSAADRIKRPLRAPSGVSNCNQNTDQPTNTRLIASAAEIAVSQHAAELEPDTVATVLQYTWTTG